MLCYYSKLKKLQCICFYLGIIYADKGYRYHGNIILIEYLKKMLIQSL